MCIHFIEILTDLFKDMTSINPTMTQIIYGSYLFFCGIFSINILIALMTNKLKEYINLHKFL